MNAMRELQEKSLSIKKMLALAFDGITSLSVKPLRMITMMGAGISILSVISIIWVIISYFAGRTVCRVV